LGERVAENALSDGLTDFVVPDSLVRRLGQAVNSAQGLLLYGLPGNGKTTLAERIGALFTEVIFIPYCLEVDSKIIKVYDPALHERVTDPEVLARSVPELADRKAQDIDERWVACKRPMVKAGGELTLEMLDLQLNPHTKFYEAPLHLKAVGGTLLIDDLGRQLVKPEDLLNRWITPMDKRVDYLSLDTGRTFTIPFDVFVIFATNLTPEDLMDPAFLRRIAYKVRIKRPSPDDYRQVFRKLCDKHGLAYDESLVDFTMDQIENALQQPLSYYQPGFLVGQIVAACKYEGRRAEMNVDLLVDALDNISLQEDMVRREAYNPTKGYDASTMPGSNGGGEVQIEDRPQSPFRSSRPAPHSG
jgi:SpoVK/Ycf46/Vps4 family AAA+-type ATPase